MESPYREMQVIAFASESANAALGGVHRCEVETLRLQQQQQNAFAAATAWQPIRPALQAGEDTLTVTYDCGTADMSSCYCWGSSSSSCPRLENLHPVVRKQERKDVLQGVLSLVGRIPVFCRPS